MQNKINNTINNLISMNMIKSANFLKSIDLNISEKSKERLSLFYIAHENSELGIDYIKKYLIENYFHSTIQFQSTHNFYEYLRSILKPLILYSQKDIEILNTIFYHGDLFEEPENDLRLRIFLYKKIFFEDRNSINNILSNIQKKQELEKNLKKCKNPFKRFIIKLSINKIADYDRIYIINQIRRNLDF